MVVVVESEGQRKAIMVDRILGKQEVVIKSLGAGLKEVKGLAGGAIMGDGRVGLILDVNGLFHIAENYAGSGGRPNRAFGRRSDSAASEGPEAADESQAGAPPEDGPSPEDIFPLDDDEPTGQAAEPMNQATD